MNTSYAPDALGNWPLWLYIAIPAAAVLTWVAWSLLRATNRPAPTPHAASTPATHATPTRAHCAVALCDDEATVHIYASNEFWSFCQPHGMPYLTEELAS